MLWSLCATCFIFLLGAVNVVRAGRPGDRALAWVALVFNLCWLVATVAFGRLIGNLADPRVIGFVVITLVLSGMSVRTMRGGPIRD